MLIVIGILSVLCVGFGVWYIKTYSGLNLIVSVSSGVFAFILISVFIVLQYVTPAQISKFKSIQTTIDNQRTSNMSEIERAAITNEMIEANMWLTEVKYWNKTILGDCIPDEIEELTPIK